MLAGGKDVSVFWIYYAISVVWMLKCVRNCPNSISLDLVPGEWAVWFDLTSCNELVRRLKFQRVAFGNSTKHPALVLLDARYCAGINIMLLGYQHALLCMHRYEKLHYNAWSICSMNILIHYKKMLCSMIQTIASHCLFPSTMHNLMTTCSCSYHFARL